MPVYVKAGSVLVDAGSVAVSEDCCCGCPCQPTHMSVTWTITDTGDPGVGEPTFDKTFTSEVDIPDLTLSGCIFAYFDCRTFVESDVTDCPGPIFADPTVCFELSLTYDSGLLEWVVFFDIHFDDHAIKCGGHEAWPNPFGCGVSIDGSLGTRAFACPPATIDEALTGGGTCPNLSGHGTVSFT